MALTIREDRSAADLRAYARRAVSPRAAARAYAIANALEGMSRAEAARLAGMERQALRDAVVRYNAEGLTGLLDRPKPGRPPLTNPLISAESGIAAIRRRFVEPRCDRGRGSERGRGGAFGADPKLHRRALWA